MIYKPYKHLVQYYETDQMGIVHHSNYIRWFEEARSFLLEENGFGYKKMEESGIISPVLSVNARYKSMTHYYDTVIINVKVIKYNGVKITLEYTVIDAVKKLAADVGIPADLKDIVKPEDIPFLAQSAYDDACRPGNPRETSVEEITKLYESLI